MIGRTSQFLYTVVCTNKGEIPDAEALYKFCMENWKEKPISGPCHHYERNFFLTRTIQQPKDTTTNTLQGTRQLHSIRSVGLEGIVEIRQSSYFCPNCRGGEGECYNKHLVLEWTKMKLAGKRELDVKMNHWHNVYTSDVCKKYSEDTPATKPDVPKTKQKSRDNEDGLSTKHDVQNKSAVPRIFLVATSGNNNARPSPMLNDIDASTRRRIAAWEQKRLQMEACINYEELMSVVRNTNLEHHFKILDGICHAKGNFHIDCTAQHFYPQDTPEHLIPCKCHGDGNCFMRALSNLLFGTEDHHVALHAAAVFEIVIHKSYYLDNIYLKYGGTNDNNLRSQYAVYSGVYNDVVTIHWNDNTIENIYEAEVLEMRKNGSHCGMWQFYQASNITNRPIRSVYPVGFLSENYRKDLNRTAFPIQLHNREEKELAIMWTLMRMEGKPVHFVPLVKL